ncbi:hypothetical protein [Vulcanisaeta sp. JCM 16161]|uniref:hypothetical protein n=1 Tax=Vulcanisaeta sp. JCM 16161 TaxID=1295372 RepID=UPI001FB35D1D|nr:hypothetical protein [Vulcanisaeta sp. JCM 16161]
MGGEKGGRLEFLLASPTSMYVVLLGTSLVMIVVNVGAFTIASLPLFYVEYGLIGTVRLALAFCFSLLDYCPFTVSDY